MPLGCLCLYYIREQASATTWTLDRISDFEWTSLDNCNIAEVQSSKVLVLHFSPAVSRVRKRRMRSSFSRFQTTNYKVLDWSWLFLVIISTVLTVTDKIRSEVKYISSPTWRCEMSKLFSSLEIWPKHNMRSWSDINRLHGLIFYVRGKIFATFRSKQVWAKTKQRENRQTMNHYKIIIYLGIRLRWLFYNSWIFDPFIETTDIHQ